jgi:hypothetical protein
LIRPIFELQADDVGHLLKSLIICHQYCADTQCVRRNNSRTAACRRFASGRFASPKSKSPSVMADKQREAIGTAAIASYTKTNVTDKPLAGVYGALTNKYQEKN